MKNNKPIRKFSKKNKKTVYKKNKRTFRNNRRSLKGGFNPSQFAGALAVCSLLEMNKIVLIPKPNTNSKRYEFIFDKDKKPTLSKGKFIVPGTRSNINISNFFIFVGSTDSNVLIKIDGNDNVVDRLANLTKNILKKENALSIVDEKQPKSQTTQEEPIKSDALVVVEGIEGSINNAEENLNKTLNEIGKFEQYLDDGTTVTPTPSDDDNFKCVMPYTKSNATNKDRLKSCNKVGTPDEKFKNSFYTNLQTCVEQCHD